jgi:hypothetical protein
MGRTMDLMHPELSKKYSEFDLIMFRKGIPYIITCVERNITEQMALYVQGRLPFKDVNRFRRATGLYLFKSEKENANKVTWTLNSKHIINPAKGINYSEAFDFAIMKDDRVTWDLKVNVNKNEIPDYIEAGKIWESLGGVAGYKFNDYCHLQIGN